MEVISDIETVWVSQLIERELEAFPHEVRRTEMNYIRPAVTHRVEMEIARLLKENDGMAVMTDSILEARREARAEGKKFVLIIDSWSLQWK